MFIKTPSLAAGQHASRHRLSFLYNFYQPKQNAGTCLSCFSICMHCFTWRFRYYYDHTVCLSSAALCIVIKRWKIGLLCAYKSNRNVGGHCFEVLIGTIFPQARNWIGAKIVDNNLPLSLRPNAVADRRLCIRKSWMGFRLAQLLFS